MWRCNPAWIAGVRWGWTRIGILERRTLLEVFGIVGMTFGIWGLIAKLRKEFEDLKKNLEDSGVLSRAASAD